MQLAAELFTVECNVRQAPCRLLEKSASGILAQILNIEESFTRSWTYLWAYPFTKIRSGRMATRSAVYTSTPLRSLCPADRLLSNLIYC